MTTRFRWGSSLPVCSRYCSRPSQTVGTAAVAETRSLSSISYTLGPSRPAPGMTILAPAAGTEKVSAQALAWNIGTMASMLSSERSPNTSG